METYPEQFPDESRPDPSYRSEDPVFDAIQGTDRSDFANHEGHPDPRSAGNGLHPMVIGRGPLRAAGQGYPVATE